MDRVDGVYAQWSVFIYSWQSWILSQCLTPLIAEWHEALIISPVAADDLALPPATHSHEYGHSHAVLPCNNLNTVLPQQRCEDSSPHNPTGPIFPRIPLYLEYKVD